MQSINPTDLRSGHVLCGTDGRPFAVVDTVRKQGQSVRVTTRTFSLPRQPFLPVSFPKGTTAEIL